MSQRGTPQSELIDGMYANFQAAVLKQLPRTIGRAVMDHWINDQNALKEALYGALLPPLKEPPVIDWYPVYEKLGMKELLQGRVFGEAKAIWATDTNRWIVPVVNGVTLTKLIEVFQNLGLTVTYSVNNSVVTDDRDPRNGSYIVRFFEESEVISKNDKEVSLKWAHRGEITLPERLLLELGTFMTTGQHLQGMSWCKGTHDQQGAYAHVVLTTSRHLRIYMDFWNPDNKL